MRLGQLARKLAIRPSEIVEFLANNQFQIEDGSNTRLEDHYVGLIMEKFAPLSTKEDIAAASMEKDEVTTASDQLLPKIKERFTEPRSESLADAITPNESVPEVNNPEIAEVIKAPKVELSGLKIIGKIELPETKKKEIATDAESDKADVPVVRQAETRRTYNIRRDTKTTKNPVSAAREREAEQAKKKREDEEELLREQRTKNYYKKVKVSAPTRRMTLIDEASEELSLRDVAEPPKTLIGRFFRWLKT